MYTACILARPWFEFSSFKSSLGFFGFLSPSPSSVCFIGGCCFIVMIFCLGLSVAFLFTHVLFLLNFVLPKWQKLQISFSGEYLSFGSSASRCWNLPLKIPCCEDHCEVWLTRHWQDPFLAEHPSECLCILNTVQYFLILGCQKIFFCGNWLPLIAYWVETLISSISQQVYNLPLVNVWYSSFIIEIPLSNHKLDSLTS